MQRKPLSLTPFARPAWSFSEVLASSRGTFPSPHWQDRLGLGRGIKREGPFRPCCPVRPYPTSVAFRQPIRQHLRRDPQQFVCCLDAQTRIRIVQRSHMIWNQGKLACLTQNKHRIGAVGRGSIVCPRRQLWECGPCQSSQYAKSLKRLHPAKPGVVQTSPPTKRTRKTSNKLPELAWLESRALNQPRQPICSNLPDGIRRHLHLLRVVVRHVQEYPLTQLFPLIRRLLLPGPKHCSKQRHRHTSSQDQRNSFSPFHS
jgi:hypothetical protein